MKGLKLVNLQLYKNNSVFIINLFKYISIKNLTIIYLGYRSVGTKTVAIYFYYKELQSNNPPIKIYTTKIQPKILYTH